MDLTGQLAVVTGAASGIGRATALLLASRGCSVACLDLSLAQLRDTVALVDSDDEGSGRAVAIPCDVSDETAVIQALDTAQATFPQHPLTIMIANAGIVGPIVGTVLDIEGEDWEGIFKVNVQGCFYCIKHAASRMMEQGTKGSIVCTASVAGLRSGAGSMPYSASKAAVINMCQVAACDLGGSGIRVNAVCPGLVETGMTRVLFDMADARGTRGKIGQLNPLARPGTPEDIARVIVFLAGEDSGYVNGQAIAVCGGLSSSHPVVTRYKARM